jgi:glycosyltransferase involved in cell wall biosynthesis
MRVLIIVPQQDRISGNWVTALRFEKGLENLGCSVEVIETPLEEPEHITKTAEQFKPDVALLLHAYRSGLPWRRSLLSLPYAVMLTGTDQNLGLDDQHQQEIILEVIHNSASVVIQNPLLAADFAKHHPLLADKLRQPSPGITLGTSPYNLFEKHDLSTDLPTFLCPAGLRPVKGVLELLEMIGQSLTPEPQFQLAICGPILDSDYGEECLTRIAEKSWAHHLGAIPADCMAAVFRQVDVVINNSFAEGLSNSLLEATALGRPILARNIPGNAAVVEHGVNGFLYNDVAEFATFLKELCKEDARNELSHPSLDKFTPQREAKELFEILKQAQDNKI